MQSKLVLKTNHKRKTNYSWQSSKTYGDKHSHAQRNTEKHKHKTFLTDIIYKHEKYA